jgi:cell division septum initiation protein DivIVA
MMEKIYRNPTDLATFPAGRPVTAEPGDASWRAEFVSSSSPRMKIRCPNCQNDGSARAELLNRRVSCKHCSFIFRAIPVDDNAAPTLVHPDNVGANSTPRKSDSAPKMTSLDQIEALELEVRRLRDRVSADRNATDGGTESLRTQLAQVQDALKKAEAREKSLHQEVDRLRDQIDQTISTNSPPDDPKNRLREEELRFLRDQLDKARAEVESEARRRRETASTLTAKTAEHAQAIVAKQDEHARALASKQDEHARALAAKGDEHGRALATKEEEHARVLRSLLEELDKVKTSAQAVEARRMAADAARTAAENRHADEDRALRDELARTKTDLNEARQTLDGLRLDRDRVAAEQGRVVEELRGRIVQLESRLVDADGVRAHRDQLAGELETQRTRFLEVERLASQHKDGAEGLRQERDRIEAARATELAELREQLDKARVAQSDLDSLRHERDEARIQRDRFTEELDALRARLDEADKLAAQWGYDSTELEVPHAVDSAEPEKAKIDSETSTVYDGGLNQLRADFDRARAEAESLRLELTEAAERLGRKDSEIAELAKQRDRASAEARESGRLEAQKLTGEQNRAEFETLRRELEKAKSSAEAASRSNLELTARIRALESIPSPAPAASAAVAAIDPAVLEAERKKAVDEAVKGAWADFERRLAETQAKLKAANSRADMMEMEAREAREQFAARERGLDLGDGSSFEEAASMTSIRILNDRGNARLTPADAEARLALAKQLAVERKDKALIDRISKMAEKVKDDLEARNYTLAETLVRGAEIETGLDPGGFSINGLRIFRASPTIVGSLTALGPAFDRVMRQGDLISIRSTLEEMRTILGDQAGLPELRRVGRTPAIKRPIGQDEAVRLFVGALEGESWLVRPISMKKPLPETSLNTYAALIEGCCLIHKMAEEHAPERVSFLDSVIVASCLMITRRQQPDGHFSFLDPRGKSSKAATIVDAMVAQRPDAVKDGWVVHVDPIGMTQTETGVCAVALASAAKTLGRAEWASAAQKASDWAVSQPCLPNFVANAASAGLLARAYLDAKQDRHLVGLAKKLNVGILPGQVENGRWIDSSSATTPNHLLILRALHDAWDAIPADRADLRRDLKPCIDLAMASLLAECKALGVPPQGNALRDLLHHRDLFKPASDPRLEAAILDSVTVIQELCHDGAKPKLGVAPDQLAALIRV